MLLFDMPMIYVSNDVLKSIVDLQYELRRTTSLDPGVGEAIEYLLKKKQNDVIPRADQLAIRYGLTREDVFAIWKEKA